jgi:outer membrane protein assembly factor BamB
LSFIVALLTRIPERIVSYTSLKGPLMILLLAALLAAQDWTRFRGPDGAGLAGDVELPETWTESDYKWKVSVPGLGHGQPVAWGDKLFLLSSRNDGQERLVLCLSAADGKTLWTAAVPMATHKKHKDSSYASGTPVVDAERVYAVFASPQQHLVKAFDHSGRELWGADLGPFQSEHGHASSPVLFEGRLIVQNDQIGESSVVAFDAKTGERAWTCPRRPDGKASFSTPTILQRPGKSPELLLSCTAFGLSSIDAASGRPNWEARVFDKRTVSSPVVAGDLVIGTCGEGSGANTVVAVKLGGKGDVTASHVAWKIQKSAPYVPTPLVSGNRVYLLHDKGFVSCAEASTGRIVWTDRVGGSFYGSPVLAGGKLYALSMQGECVVLAAGDEYKVLGKNPLGEGSHSTPCVAGGRLYLRTFGHLLCVGAK